MQIFGKPNSHITYIPRPGAYGIYQRPDQYLAVIKVGERYFLPGGGKEGAESDHECLQRECMEELGWTITVGEFLGENGIYLTSPPTDQYFFIHMRFFRILTFKPVTSPSEVNHELEWMSSNEACVRLHSAAQRAIIAEFFSMEYKE